MKIAHWTFTNGSGLAKVAHELCEAEKALGLDSVIIDSGDIATWEAAKDATHQCVHSYLPEKFKLKSKVVFFTHGTPEHVFRGAVQGGQGGGGADSFCVTLDFLRTCDAAVTFWPRHAAIWQSLCDKRTRIETVPMGLNRGFWQPQGSRGKYAGSPSVLTAENCADIKWPLDVFLAWPWVKEGVPDAVLHAHYLPTGMHRWFMPLVYRNGVAYSSYITPNVLGPEDLRNGFCSVDYYLNLVRYGDFNRIGLEAKACGCKVISYESNPFADYWITEGDQRKMADQLTAIFKGTVKARTPKKVPAIAATVRALKEIYESL